MSVNEIKVEIDQEELEARRLLATFTAFHALMIARPDSDPERVCQAAIKYANKLIEMMEEQSIG